MFLDHTKSSYQLSLDDASRLEIEEDGSKITRTIEPNGMRVITQEVPTSRSVVLGFWVPAGSRDEGERYLGSTHYLEHLLFKGSRTRNAIQIAKAFDQVGGEFNAATAKESTHYYFRVLVRDLPMALDVMTEMLAEPNLREDDFQMEQSVILDELAMSQDDPTDVAYETFCETIFADHPLGAPVGGTPDTVKATPLSAVREHHSRWYQPRHLVVAAAGGISHDLLLGMLNDSIARTSWKHAVAAKPSQPSRSKPGPISSAKRRVNREFEQAQVIWGCRSLAANSEQRDVMSMLLTLLSGGMSSRLFQEIREKRGLAYSTYASDSSFSDTGLFTMYAGCAPKNVPVVQDLMVQQLESLAAGQISEEERLCALGQLSGGVALGLESNRARMGRLGRSEVISHQLRTVEQLFSALAKVSVEEVANLASSLLQKPSVQVVVGEEKE